MSRIEVYKTPVYLFAWGAISLISSFNNILKLDFSFIEKNDFHCGIIAPLLIWIIAFFFDYVYTVSKIGNNEELDKEWTQRAYEIICFIFVVLLLSLYHHGSLVLRLIWMGLLYCGIILLKSASLNIIRPRVELKTV
jgi:hypothetical protein